MTDENNTTTDEKKTIDYQSKMLDMSELLDRAKKALEEASSIGAKINLDSSFTTTEGDEKKLAEFKEQMTNWKKEGYNIERLEIAISTGIPELAERIFSSYERDVTKLREVETSLESLDATGFKRRVEDIRESLKNPEKAILTLKHFIELEIDVRRRKEMDV